MEELVLQKKILLEKEKLARQQEADLAKLANAQLKKEQEKVRLKNTIERRKANEEQLKEAEVAKAVLAELCPGGDVGEVVVGSP